MTEQKCKAFFQSQGNPVSMFVLQTLVLYECEKHPREEDWEDAHIGDRISGILMQLISCLQVNIQLITERKQLLLIVM